MSAFSDNLPFINSLGLATNLKKIELRRSIIGSVTCVVVLLLALTRVNYCES